MLGGLLIALGVLLIGASVAGLVTTFGSSSALSAVGIALGLSLLQTQVVLGVTSTIAAATGIGLTFLQVQIHSNLDNAKVYLKDLLMLKKMLSIL